MDWELEILLRSPKENLKFMNFFLDYDYHKEPNRDWLCNVINTVIPDKFKEFINKKTKERNKKLGESHKLKINADRYFIDFF